MKKAGNELCDRCKRRPVCQDYKDSMAMRSEGLTISIVECEQHIPETLLQPKF